MISLKGCIKENILILLLWSWLLDEPLPGEPKPLPSKAPHLTDHFYQTNKGEMIQNDN